MTSPDHEDQGQALTHVCLRLNISKTAHDSLSALTVHVEW